MDARLAELTAHEPDETWDGWAMSNLRPARTGLPMVVWVQHGEGVRHDVRVKVAMTHGDRLNRENLAVVSVRPEPRLLHGELSRDDLDAVVRWIELNERAIIQHWDGETDTADLLDAIQKV